MDSRVQGITSRLMVVIVLLVVMFGALWAIALSCGDWWLFFSVVIMIYGALKSRFAAYILLPVAYISLYHAGALFDAYELFVVPGDLYEKLVALKIAYVHTLPVSYWLGILGELCVLLVSCYTCRFIRSRVLCRRICGETQSNGRGVEI